ncbi:MAG: bacillithiol system redox-active protein YtxJ [Pyrinomonadaceae bacterium]
MPARFNQITSEAQLDALFEDSRSHAVALVKHSDTCGISANVMYDLREIDADINVIVIQQNRDLSNDLAERINHRHQSPQAFVIKDGKAIYHATHYGIDPAAIESKLRN